MRHRRLLLSLMLVTVGVYLLVGCIPMPGNFKLPDGSRRPETKIGEQSDSSAPLRMQVSTRDQVVSIIGRPYLVTRDGRALIYDYRVNTRSVFWPLCFFLGVQKEYDVRYLLIQFTDDLRIQSYKVSKDLRVLRRHLSGELFPPENIVPLPSGAREPGR